MSDPQTRHVPVMLDEIVEGLAPRPGAILVDGTLGGGGHARALAERVGESGLVIALDRDPAALEAAEHTLKGLPIKLVHANFCEIPEVLEQIEIPAVDGIVLDVGLSSDQLAAADRGFSFHADGPLDLRFDTSAGEPAWRMLERIGEKDLADMIYQFGEERHSRRIARAIVAARRANPVRTAHQLADLVRSAMPRAARRQKIDPATRTFQALRIVVNDELRSLEIALRRLPDCLVSGGKLAVISFHSLEDRLVKTAFRDDPRLETQTRRPLRPSETEIANNPRARSAKTRIATRVGDSDAR